MNHLCSYRQVGRYYFILQMAITDREREIKCPAVPTEELCARASIQMFPAYMALKGSFHLKLLNCRPCDHKPCQLPAASSETSSVQNKHGMGGGQCRGAGMSNSDETDVRND